MLATGEFVDLAKWIIDDTCVVSPISSKIEEIPDLLAESYLKAFQIYQHSQRSLPKLLILTHI